MKNVCNVYNDYGDVHHDDDGDVVCDDCDDDDDDINKRSGEKN